MSSARQPLVFKVRGHTITEEQAENLLCSWFEGGYSNFWVEFVEEKTPPTTPTEYLFQTPLRGGSLAVTADGEEFILDLAALEKGLQAMARRCPGQFKAIIDEQDDAITGDMLVQFALFGEERYC